MADSEEKTESGQYLMKLFFELYHLVVVAGAFVGLAFVTPYVNSLNFPRNDFAFLIIVASPVVFFLIFWFLTKKIRPGRIALVGIITAFVLEYFYPPRSMPSGPLILPIFIFTTWFIVTLFPKRERRSSKALVKEERRQREAARPEGIHLSSEGPGPVMQKAQPSPASMLMKGAYAVYLFVIVLGAHTVFILLVREMLRSWNARTFYASIWPILVYPAALYGIMVLVTRNSVKFGYAFFSSVLAGLLLFNFFPPTDVMVLISFPTLCLCLGFVFSSVKWKKRKKGVILSMEGLPEEEPELDETGKRMETRNRQDRKFASQRQASRWFRHPWFSR